MGRSAMVTAVLAGVVSLAGVVVGARLSFHYDQGTARQSVLAEQRTSAYVQYIEATTKMSQLSKLEEAQKEQRNLRNAARFRMVVYSSAPVIEALADVERSLYGTKEWKQASLRWFKSVRNELAGGGDDASLEALAAILYETERKRTE